MRNGGLIQRQRVGEIADADLVACSGERSEHGKPVGVGDGLQEGRRRSEFIRDNGSGRTASLHRHISILDPTSIYVNIGHAQLGKKLSVAPAIVAMRHEITHPQPVRIPAGEVELDGDLTHTTDARGLIIFVHGSGSSRFSTRNRHVARMLNNSGFATLLADLLTPKEDAEDQQTAALRFDIALLAERTVAMIAWASAFTPLKTLTVGLFGASTGAAAAIIAAAQRPDSVHAIVSRGGRVDLAGEALTRCRAPLLMLVGSSDEPVEKLNRESATRLSCKNSLIVVSGASHLFEEPGALDRVADLAAEWFQRYLPML